MKTLPAGIYTAVPTFFLDNEDIDVETFRRHLRYVSKAGSVPVISGTMGEACHLSPSERTLLVTITREVLDMSPATEDIPVITGVGSSSTRESIELAKSAALAGADFVMLIPPGYYAGALKADNMAAVKQYIIDVSEASPVPLIVYNFPAVSSGIDMDSDFVIDMVKKAPNVCGMKFTCANVGKIGRITSTLRDTRFQAFTVPYFHAIDGFIDILLPSMAVHSSGAITAISNFVPKSCVKLWQLCEKAPTSPEAYAEAQRLQELITNADGGVQRVGVSGMKAILEKQFGYGGRPRRPLLPMRDELLNALLKDDWLQRLLRYEASI
ncbi:hypothetical protein PV08_07599 [Exophiala spinifera]|uniref:Dihydrodipicolinate synthase n=1 Tax=Exophiala spinifera TaxID=91928 RepID=A0A0D2BU59_9EURO|nr:uncharacterized protein PV08_07599 [Exophiala spinifera]KIW14814.1 hypothetical protein PV08_07599 [Exophiala spinifera]